MWPFIETWVKNLSLFSSEREAYLEMYGFEPEVSKRESTQMDLLLLIPLFALMAFIGKNKY